MKKRPLLLKSIYGLKGQDNKKVIGLVGTHPGVGVTHTGIMLTCFIRSVLGGRTAFLEMNAHKDFSRIEKMCLGKREEMNKFCLKKVTYYKQVNQKEITDIMNEDYDYIVIDFGSELNNNKMEFLRCDKKFVISSITDWKRDSLSQFIQTNRITKGHDAWIYLFIFGQNKDITCIKREEKIKAKIIGYEPNPYVVSNEIISLFHSII